MLEDADRMPLSLEFSQSILKHLESGVFRKTENYKQMQVFVTASSTHKLHTWSEVVVDTSAVYMSVCRLPLIESTQFELISVHGV